MQELRMGGAQLYDIYIQKMDQYPSRFKTMYQCSLECVFSSEAYE